MYSNLIQNYYSHRKYTITHVDEQCGTWKKKVRKTSNLNVSKVTLSGNFDQMIHVAYFTFKQQVFVV